MARPPGFTAQALQRVRVPERGTVVHKAECCLSFQTPRLPGGLLVDLATFQAFSPDYAMLNYKKTGGSAIYLRITQTKRPADETCASEDAASKKPKQLAIGTPDGFEFDHSDDKYDESYAVVILPGFEELPYPNADLPIQVQRSIAAVLAAEGEEHKQDVAAWAANEERPVSKYAADLQQLNNGVKVPPGGWKCADCDKTENLWLNMTDGHIGCGRKFFDGTGGNNHAMEHFTSSRHPLCVKLGTITPSLEGIDIYSYAEDSMVTDPHLERHLEHFGIDVARAVKSEKTLAEMELDANISFDFSRLTESGKALSPLSGPGLTGMHNLGNTCYMASVLQALFSCAPVAQRFYRDVTLEDAFLSAPGDPATDMHLQLVKIGHGLLSGRYSPGEGGDGVTPRAFKALVGRGHAEFGTSRQQDAQEFYSHVLEAMSQAATSGGPPDLVAASTDPARAFAFLTETRVTCSASGMSRYSITRESQLTLPIPLEAATNAAELESFAARAAAAERAGTKLPAGDVVRPRVPLAACIASWAAEEVLDGYYSSATRAVGRAATRSRLATFPDFMVLHMRRFVADTAGGWVSKKLDVFVDAPLTLDLGALRAPPRDPAEPLLPEEDSPPAPAAPAVPVPNPDIVAALVAFDVPRHRAERAALATGNTSADDAMNWLFSRDGDADDAAPPPPPPPPVAPVALAPAAAVSADSVAMLESMGFDATAAIRALRAAGGALEAAAEMLLTGTVPADAPPAAAPAQVMPVGPPPPDGPGTYKLKGFVSHMGTSTMSGHYVAHLLLGGRWVLFNDGKVALSETPPTDLAYLYFYERAPL